MSILEETKTLLKPLGYPIETGVFKNKPPDSYIVFVPLADSYPISADDMPLADVQELRISLFTKGNYLQVKNKITKQLLANDYCITDRRYNGYDADTGYHQYVVDVEKNYEMEET